MGDVGMWRWTMRIFVVLGAFFVVAALSGATYQWRATRKELAATPPPGHRSESRIASALSAAIRAGDEVPRGRIPGGG
jgi:hypothetical protein